MRKTLFDFFLLVVCASNFDKKGKKDKKIGQADQD